MNIDRLAYLLESDSIEITTDKLYYLAQLFTLAKYLLLDKKTKKLLELERNNYEIVDYYLDCVDYDLKEFNRWKNIETLNDILELKSLLKKWYVCLEMNDKLKPSIISVLDNFVVEDDREFYINTLNDVFIFQDIIEADSIIFSCGNALSYIEKIQIPTSNDSKLWVKGKAYNIETSRIMYNRANFFYKHMSRHSHFKAINYLLEQKDIKFLDTYHFYNPLFSTQAEKEIGSYVK